MKFQLLLWSFAVVISGSFGETATSDESSHRRPNVLFIAVDDLNNWACGLSEYTRAKTPNIERLADRGVLFTNAHCAAPACNPSRVSVMTGLRPSTSGVYFNNQDWRQSKTLENIVTLPGHFRNNGYKVLGGGKLYHAATLSDWGHEGYLDPKPWHEYFPSKSQQLPKEVSPETIPLNGSPNQYRGYMDWAQLDILDEEMADAKVVSWAERQLSVVHDQPLFLGVGIYRPHIPWYTPKKWFDDHPIEALALPEIKQNDLDDIPEAGREMARRRWHQWMVENDKWRDAVQGYLASVSFADAMVGRLLDALDAGPHADNTIVVLWTDHGYHLGHKEHWEKFALWEQTTQVPLIVVDAKSSVEQNIVGRRCDRPASLLDIYPTLVELSGLDSPGKRDGESLVPYVRDPSFQSATLPSATLPTDRAVVTTQGPGNHAVRSQHWRYIRYADGAEELYDHRRDPHEFKNLASESRHDSVKRELAKNFPKRDRPLDPPKKK